MPRKTLNQVIAALLISLAANILSVYFQMNIATLNSVEVAAISGALLLTAWIVLTSQTRLGCISRFSNWLREGRREGRAAMQSYGLGPVCRLKTRSFSVAFPCVMV